MSALYQIIKVDPLTSARLETYDDELNDKELDEFLSYPDETKVDRDGTKLYRFADDWFSYICIQE